MALRRGGEGLEPDLGRAWARRTTVAVWERLAARDFAGWDPYDALSGRRLPPGAVRRGLAGRAVTQAVKRSPLPLQPLLGVAPLADAYTLGHALLAAARLGAAGALPDAARHCEVVWGRLDEMAAVDGGARAWGYHFPVRTRFFSYSPPTPNLIVSAFVAKGLAAATRVGLLDGGAGVRGVAAFILEGLPRIADATGQCVGYVPGERAAVHNANMLAALVLCEAAELGGERAWVDEALACARFTVARQEDDGSWPYSEENYGRWVDGFHTGFVLEGLARTARATGDEELQRALARGVRYYVAQLFGPRGEPKYHPERAYPLDALSAAQGVETLHVALGGHCARAVPGQLEWIERELVEPNGRVAYQVHRRWTDRRAFPRWASAPLMSALAGVAAGAGAGPHSGSAAGPDPGPDPGLDGRPHSGSAAGPDPGPDPGRERG